ncbi:abortive infection family protein [Tateyamaria sp.]|uniref:abortive infection family protein n=1 Tax=Tateyamaria sp. TaxID=1929288 RepID=UPI00329D3C45
MLDFSNRTFVDFFEDHFDINIYADAFSEKGTSKFNRLQAFVELSPPHLVIEVLKLLWERRNQERNEEIENAEAMVASDASSGSSEHLEMMHDEAANEDRPFEKLIGDFAGLASHVGAPHLAKVSSEWTLDTLEREFKRAFENVDTDPEAAVTASCSMLESVCRSVLKARGISPPKSLDIKSLYKAVREPLGLSPAKHIPDDEIEADVRAILSALSNATQGIGALRTHAGTAHGRERGFRRLDPRIARLSVNTSTSLALFLMETWEKKFPGDKLPKSTEL